MKLFIFIFSTLISLYASGQQLTTEIQARKGVFTERLYLYDKWIDGISANLNSDDSTRDNVLVTAKGASDFMRFKSKDAIRNQFSVLQRANVWLQGTGVISAHPNYRKNLAADLPAQMYVTQGSGQYGVSTQNASNLSGPADIVLLKNAAPDFFSLQPLQPGDSIGSFIFSGVAGNNSTVANAMSMHGLVEKTGSYYIASGYVFNTTDSNGVFAQRMWLNAQGSLLLGEATTNPYRLNVASGDVRVGTLSGSGLILTGSGGDGVLTKIQPGNNVYFSGNTLNVAVPKSDNSWKYVVTLSQAGTSAPQPHIFQNSMGNIVWTRNSPGNYTGTLIGAFQPGYVWMESEASDQNGNAVITQLFRSGPGQVTLIVKDATLTNIDTWTNISIQIREWPTL